MSDTPPTGSQWPRVPDSAMRGRDAQGRLLPGFGGRPKGVPNKSTRMLMKRMQERADEIIDAVLDTALQDIRKITDRDGKEHPGPACGACGRGLPRDENLMMRSRLAVLDRLGLGPTTKVEIAEGQESAWLEYLTDAQLVQLSAWIDEARERMPVDEVIGDEETIN